MASFPSPSPSPSPSSSSSSIPGREIEYGDEDEDESSRAYFFSPPTTLPPLAVQFSLVVFMLPWPLQPFLPAHEWPLP